ncbi:helix-turn-helix domain-containing protein [Chryseobacterium sp. 5_R23647]|uniref:helix-turn-helix domain-containing protein n=1 Tax=Chryseobacterium sp. 5_R23647 TaxID=2258964 RepID=UPI000E225CE1|nr:helix-turn-helix transcriptional regulator [Chryseobacterium sp. 5_R23647]REC39837.1 hypothetical protein DRF69_21240 [Chryseobacterium sp. 5_R23647]
MQKTDITATRLKLGSIIENKKLQMKISDEEFCKAVQITKNTLNRIEKGRFSPGSDLMLLMFQALNIKLKIDSEVIN